LGEILQVPTNKLAVLAFGFDGKTLVSSSEDQLMFWDFVKSKAVSSGVDAAQRGIKQIVSAPNGRELVTVGTDNSIKLWNVAARSPIKTLIEPGEETVLSVAFSVDSQTLAVGVMSKEDVSEIRLLNVPDGTLNEILVSPSQKPVSALAFNPNGKLLAFVERDSGITIWDLATHKPPKRLEHNNVYSLAFSPTNERILASGGYDSLIKLWDIKKLLPAGLPLGSHQGPVNHVVFSYDGKMLASASSDRTVLLWDVETRQRLTLPLEGHADEVLSADFSPDGQWVGIERQGRQHQSVEIEYGHVGVTGLPGRRPEFH
jgi:WD40 repeat protein